jgi:hypothetical protein
MKDSILVPERSNGKPLREEILTGELKGGGITKLLIRVITADMLAVYTKHRGGHTYSDKLRALMEAIRVCLRLRLEKSGS